MTQILKDLLQEAHDFSQHDADASGALCATIRQELLAVLLRGLSREENEGHVIAAMVGASAIIESLAFAAIEHKNGRDFVFKVMTEHARTCGPLHARAKAALAGAAEMRWAKPKGKEGQANE